MTLWHGRFGGTPSSELLAYTQSLSFDRRLAHDDISCSKAHVKGLGVAKIITGEEVEVLLTTLDGVEAELDSGQFEFEYSDEDIHTAIERRVSELAGDTGAKLHTGRSRNDQVATDLRLFSKRELAGICSRILEFQKLLMGLAESAEDVYLPGYTHLQRAQPVLLSHYFLAHGWALARDFDRFVETIARLDVSPLGAGALGGSSLPLDPDFVSMELGFAKRFDNSLDAVSDRDFVAEALFDLALLGVHLSQIGEELVLWSTEEFGYLRLDDAYSTGSSMLPQKKNPDIAELARGKSGRVIGSLTGFLTTLKGLPLSYNRDLQEDKEPLFDALNQISLGLSSLSGLLSTAGFDFSRMRKAADSQYLCAIDLAEWLVSKGVPFRKAHAIIGGLVRDSLERHVDLGELVDAHPQLGAEAAALLLPGVSVERRQSLGGSGTEAVKIQLESFRLMVSTEEIRMDSLTTR
ncbi:MAG: argininosuccinate lyase [Acidimicrobiaceae bacterium]|nr:argininosuccinate lyase [Acidimicrobiaceae bacterium]